MTVKGDGTCVGADATFALANGKMTGSVYSSEYDVTVPANGNVTANGEITAGTVDATTKTTGSYWTGKITGDTASGKWESVVNGCSGTWTLNKQKA